MKIRKFFLIGCLAFLFSGCVVYSFYPLYTENDLFPNDILTGKWGETDAQEVEITEGESTWIFEHPLVGDTESEERDSLSYTLTLQEITDNDTLETVFQVHLIQLEGQYFLDFYMPDFAEGDHLKLADLHVIPVHTFARLSVVDERLTISWFDPEWLEELIDENKIRIRHEQTDDFVLLTAKPQELQKFVAKYIDSEEAFDHGLKVILQRK